MSMFVSALGVTFLSPTLAIAGAACIAVPIIIHLLTRQRRRPIPWAAMKFLLEAYKKHRRRLTLEQLLLLACRCLVVLLVGLALGRPILGDLIASRGPVHLYLLIDNSLLSQAREDSGPADARSAGRLALDRFKEQAKELLTQLDASHGDRAGIIPLAGPAEPAIFPPSTDLGAVGRVLDDLTGSESRPDLAGALARLRAELSAPGGGGAAGSEAPARTVLAILSDFRAGGMDLSQALPTLGSGGVRILSLAPAQGGIDNTAISGIEPLRPVLMGGGAGTAADSINPGGNQVRVSLRRFGPGVSRSATTPVHLALCDVKSLGTASGAGARAVVQWLPGQETATATLQVQPPETDETAAMALVARIDADAVAADDVMVRPIESRRVVRIAVVESLRISASGQSTIDEFTPGDWVRLVLEPEGGTGPSLTSAPPSGLVPTTIDPASVGRSGLSGFDAAIVLAPDELTSDGWRRLAEFSATGGLLVVAPPAGATVHVWGDAFCKAMGLEWSIGREATAFPAPIGISPEAPGGTGNPLLGLLSTELPALAKPVSVFKAIAISGPAGSLVPILNLSNGSPLIAAAPAEAGDASASPGSGAAGAGQRGTTILLATAIDLSWTDLPTKPLMLPLVQEMVRLGVGRSIQSFDAIAGQSPKYPAGTEELLPADGRAERSGRLAGGPAGRSAAARSAGVWKAVGRRGATLSLAAINADTAASNTASTAGPQIAAWLGPVCGPDRLAILDAAGGAGGTVADEARGSVHAGSEDREPISMPLLAAALGLALLEVFMARQFSHAGREAAGGGIAQGRGRA